VLAAQTASAADKTLPPYERLLLGGASNLRGFGTGAFDGDRMFVTSAELRADYISPQRREARVTAFYDAGKAFNVGEQLQDATGVRALAGASFSSQRSSASTSTSVGLKGGDTRVHLSSGFSF
jgi:hemolysin activation/secretion protein